MKRSIINRMRSRIMKKLFPYFYIIFLLSCFFPILGWASPNYHISVSGIEGDILDNVNAQLKIEQSPLGDEPKSEKLARFIERLPLRLQRAIEPFGYFKPTIEIHVSHTKASSLINVNVIKGQPTRIAKVQVLMTGKGKDNADLQSYLSHLPLQEGVIFRADVYQKVKEDLIKLANSNGYIKSYVAQNGDLYHQYVLRQYWR